MKEEEARSRWSGVGKDISQMIEEIEDRSEERRGTG